MPRPNFTAPSPEALGELLPAYEFECLIAKGGMGAVYRAKQRSLARHVAIKILPTEFGKNPAFRASFETEARAMARLNHPNLIAVYDSGSANEMLYIVMEYVPGKSLYHSAYEKKIDPLQAAELVLGICAGLGHAHENGIIHRDIKPSNILLTPKAEPKIGDFGLARPMEAGSPGLTMGTPGYTAPEVIQNPEAADHRSDLYAVGVILYELLTGRHQDADSPAPSTLSRCGPALDEIWRRATHPDPNQRFQSAQEFHAALTSWLAKSQKSQAATPAKALAAKKPAPKPLASKAPAAAAARTRTPNTAATPAEAAPAQVDFQIKTNWHFIRNLFIIAALIVIVAVVWKKLETTRIQRDIANRQLLEDQARLKARNEALARERALEAAAQRTPSNPKTPDSPTNPDSPAAPPPTPPTPPPAESQLDILNRLRLDLVAGKRDEMPPGIIRRGSCDYLVVTTPMTWADAAWFAERFGGHLPVPTNSDDITWFGQQAPGDDFVWIGGGRSGRSAWTFLDGTTWTLTPQPKGTGTHAAISNLGTVRALDSKETHPFLIQWHRDGSNPASLDAALRAARESLGDANPVYPPGTEAFDSRHYLHVSRPIPWRDANELAQRAGGHLAVASDPNEVRALNEFINSLTAPDGLWLGASVKANQWQWTTGEPFSLTDWAAKHPATSALALFAKANAPAWEAQDPSLLTSGFIIEWSSDPDRSPAETVQPAQDNTPPAAITLRAKELVGAADKKRMEKLTNNARTFTWDLDLWLRSLSLNEQARWQLHVAKLKAAIRNARVPSTLPKEVSLSPQMAKIATRAVEKQTEINQQFLEEVNKLRTTYLTRVRAAALEADQKGDTQLSASLRTDFTKAATTEAWIESFGIDPSVTNTPAEEPGTP